MYKASRILLIVGAILAILSVGIGLILGLLFIGTYAESNKQLVQQMVDSGQVVLPAGYTVDSFMEYGRNLGTTFLVVGLLSIPCIVLSFVALSKETKLLYIIAMVAGGLGFNAPTILGAVFGYLSVPDYRRYRSFSHLSSSTSATPVEQAPASEEATPEENNPSDAQ